MSNKKRIVQIIFNSIKTPNKSQGVMTRGPLLNQVNAYSISSNNKDKFRDDKMQKNEEQRSKWKEQRKGSFLGGDQIDKMTRQTLNDYENKLKQIREHHNRMQQEIQGKYRLLMQQQSHQQQQEEDHLQELKLERMKEILNNQAKQKSKTQHIMNEFTSNFVKARKSYELDYIKKYMLENVKELGEGSMKQEKNHPKGEGLAELLSVGKSNSQSYIPNNLVLKKLYFTHDSNKHSAVLLAGVQQNDEDHCAYLKTLIEKLKIKHVLAMLSPDLPYFIKTQTSFLTEWQHFLKIPSPAVKFYLNPNPKTLNDITLTSTHIPLVLHGMTRSKSFYQTTFSLMQMNEATFKYQHQPLYTGLIAGMVENVYFCDYPFLKERQMIAMNMDLGELRHLIKRYTYYKKEKRENFSAQLLLPKGVVEKKYRHIIKMAKTIGLTKQSTPILICPASIAEVLTQEWQKSGEQYLQFDYTQNSYLLDMQLNKQGEKQTLFIEFIEKLVILDIILSPLIERYFVKYGSFPYSCRNTVGGKENLTKVFLLWKHYYSLYSNAVKGKFEREKDKWQVSL